MPTMSIGIVIIVLMRNKMPVTNNLSNSGETVKNPINRNIIVNRGIF